VRRLLAVLSAALLLGAVPVAAEEAGGPVEPPEIQECPGQQERVGVDGLSGEIDTPSIITGDGFSMKTLRLDLQAPQGARAAVTVTIDWGIRANDYDLSVNGTTSMGLQPLDDAIETVTVNVANCGLITISVEEWLAPVFVDTINLEVDVRPLG
jgi:hypothetical protein